MAVKKPSNLKARRTLYVISDRACPPATARSITCCTERKLMPRPFHPKRDIAAQNAFKKGAFLML